MLINTKNVRIEWGDCDPAGIVFYPRYFAIFDACTGDLFERATGLRRAEMTKKYDSVGIPMVDTRAVFKLPTRFGDEVTIETTILAFRRSSFDVRHELKRDGKLAVEGFETRVWAARHLIDPNEIQAKAIPPEIIALFEAG